MTSGAACVTVIADREGDIYEDFACKPSGVEVLIRAGQDRVLTDGSRLFERAASFPEAARMSIDLPAAPGRAARTAVLALRFGSVEIARPVSRKGHAELQALPPAVTLTLVEALEVDPPAGMPVAHWRLLTSHKITDASRAPGQAIDKPAGTDRGYRTALQNRVDATLVTSVHQPKHKPS